jgi:hypothetical protein
VRERIAHSKAFGGAEERVAARAKNELRYLVESGCRFGHSLLAMSVMCPTLPRSVSRSKQRDVHPANAKKSSIALKVFQNHPFFICMNVTRNQLDSIHVRPVLDPLLCC